MDYELVHARGWLLETKSRPAPVTPDSTSDASSNDDTHPLEDSALGLNDNHKPPNEKETGWQKGPNEAGWEHVSYSKKRPFIQQKATSESHRDNFSPSWANSHNRSISKRPPYPPLDPRIPAPVSLPSKALPRPKVAAPAPASSKTVTQPTSKRLPPPAIPKKLPLLMPPPSTKLFTFSKYKEDNPAKFAFRNQNIHNSSFVLDHPCHVIEPDKKKMYGMLEEIGVRFGSYIRPPQSANDRELLLWGNQQQISLTVRELQRITESSPAVHKVKNIHDFFPKVSLQEEEHAKALDKQLQQEAVKQKYQRAPDSSLSFLYTGLFLWPTDEIQPKHLLGPSLEAFDPLRVEYDSYIVWDDQLSAVKILTDRADAVQEVSTSIEGIMKEFAARNAREIRVNIVERPDAVLLRREVAINIEMLPDQIANPSKGHAIVPSLTGNKISPSQYINWRKESKYIEQQQLSQWRHLIEKALKRLRFYRCRIQMRVLMGAFALTTFRRWANDKIPLEQFVKEMEIPTTRGRIVKGLQTKGNADDLLARIGRATRLFAPANVRAIELENVFPVYTACFEFDITGTGNVRLEVDMGVPNVTEDYEVTFSQWTRKAEEAFPPFEVFNIRVQGGTSWELKTSTFNELDARRVTPAMTAFVKSIRYKSPTEGVKPEISGQKVFTWNNSLKVSSFEQKTSLRYRIANRENWIFEFGRYDTFNDSAKNDPTATHWGATLWNSDWDRILARNPNLEIGQAAEWKPTLDTFFPADRNAPGGTKELAGFQQFLKKMRAIVEFLDEMKATALPANEHNQDESSKGEEIDDKDQYRSSRP